MKRKKASAFAGAFFIGICMLYSKLFLFFVVSSFVIIDCKQKPVQRPQLPSSPEQQQRLENSKLELLSAKEKPVKLEGYPSREKAIKSFLAEVISDSNPMKSILSSEEKRKSFFPQVFGYGTALDVTPLDDYMKMVLTQEAVGIDRLRSLKLSQKEIKDLQCRWKAERQYGSLKAHILGKCTFLRNDQEQDIDQIKSIIEFNGRFKVAIVAP